LEQKKTIRLAISAEQIDSVDARRTLARAAEVLRSGGTVAFPTETVYGLGANALDAEAVAGIFAAKQRPAWDPLIVHVSSADMLDRVAGEVTPQARRLIDAFWPGPLTVLLPKGSAIPDAVTAGRPLVAVRMPAHPIARALIAAADIPIAAPSANRFGRPSATTADHVLEDLDGRIDLVLDGGETNWGMESTVVEAGQNSIRIYRLGAVSKEAIETAIHPADELSWPVEVYRPPKQTVAPESLPSPGLGIRHYAPNARLVLVDVGGGPEPDQKTRWMQTVHDLSRAKPDATGVMLPAEWPLPEHFRGPQFAWGHWSDLEELARRLYAGLRALDAKNVERILCPVPQPVELGAAIADRLHKAARDS
jgi:L-threonylcarbamoyladenylate synthase